MNERNVNLSNLPAGWVSIQLGDVVKFEYGKGLVKNKRDPNGEYVVYGSNGPVGRHSEYLVKTPCLVVGRKGSAGEVHISKKPCWPIDTTYYVVPPGGIILPFLFYLLKTLNLSSFDKSTAIPGLNRNDAYVLKICLAPLPEQHRIVAKIEELFTKLDAGKEELLQAKARLKRYRQSVLKVAMEGKLTEDWRKTHEGEIEPAPVLLDRILKERREKWEAEQLAQMRAKGKMPKDDKWKNKYKEPQPPDTSKLPELPEGWVWVTIEQLSYKVQYGSSSKCTANENGIPVFRMGNILDGKLIVNDLKYLPQEHNEFPNLLLETGDILFNRTNSAELVGKTAIYKGLPNPCSFASYLIRVKVTSGIFPDLISYYINSTYGRQWIASVVSQQVGQANVNGTKLQALAVPLPPYLEQEQIISEAEKHLSIANKVEAVVDAELKRCDALRQSILKQAFSGKLVPQDPNDEPAEKLLERITKEKSKRESEQKTKRKTKKQLALFEH